MLLSDTNQGVNERTDLWGIYAGRVRILKCEIDSTAQKLIDSTMSA